MTKNKFLLYGGLIGLCLISGLILFTKYVSRYLGLGPRLQPGQKIVISDTPTQASPSVSQNPEVPIVKYKLEKVVGNLAVPWSIAFIDQSTMLVTERPGR